MRQCLTLLSLLLLAGASHASCGSAYCTVNTNWNTQGLDHDSGVLVDLRYTYSQADQWRAGASNKATEAPSGSGEEIENKRTRNQLIQLNLDYALNRDWALQLGLPFIMRDHQHTLDSTTGTPIAQQGKFSEIGDIRVMARYHFTLDGGDAGAGIRFGFKLPTGATNKVMTPPDPASPATPYLLERSSQPGTGSTDGIVGLHYFHNTPDKGFGWFVSSQFQAAFAIRDGYRPGNELNIDTGIHYELADRLNLLLQLNAQYKGRDSGINANPASGGHSLSLSPGLSQAIDSATQVYGFIQLPLVRYVNADPADSASGQLSARWSAALGVSRRF